MKNQTFISFMALLLLASVSFIGCDNDGGGESSQDTQALTENDFAETPGLFAKARGGVVVTFLEHPGAGDEDNLTGEIGVDIIPYRFDEDLNQEFCFEDENVDAEHFAILFDSDGNEVLRVEANGLCVTEFILAGDYFLEITHDGMTQDNLPIFAIPGQNGEQTAQRVDPNQGLFKSVKTQFSKFINDLRDIITRKAKAQTPTPTQPPSPVQGNVSILLKTKECKNCILTGANLVNAPLSGADLRNALLLNANMSGADLTDANLSSSGGDKTILCGAILTSANLTSSKLCGADITDDQCSQFSTSGARTDGTIFDGSFWITSDFCFMPSNPCSSGIPKILPVAGGEETGVTCDMPAMSDNIDLSIFFGICNAGSNSQCNLITEDTKMMLQAWGAGGGRMFSDVNGGGNGGYAQTIITLGDLSVPVLFYYLGEMGHDASDKASGGGGASTAVLINTEITDERIAPLLFAGGGGGPSSPVQTCQSTSESQGGSGGIAIATLSGNALGNGGDGFGCKVCIERSGKGAPAESGGGGEGGTAKNGEMAANGFGGFGGFGGCSGPGCTLTGWFNSSLTNDDIVSFGLGGSGQIPENGCTGGGGGGGFGGGGAGAGSKFLGINGAGGGGGSFALKSTETCAIAPTSSPPNPNPNCCGAKGTVRIVFFNDADC